MSIVGILLLVVFIIIAVLLILLVLVQNEEGDSLGGIFAGGSSSAFGSRSGNILTRATTVLGALFLILSLGIALLNRDSLGSGVESAGLEQSTAAEGTGWDTANENESDWNIPLEEDIPIEGDIPLPLIEEE